ncbi:LysR family transcriptional regulator [Paraburkholderia sp. EG285A]|uniref:LysR family transcriptional regulator n=1 Tax=Paraburkholderia sp. EG285A TaxID=3237009 RepID=UPI0034D230ED
MAAGSRLVELTWLEDFVAVGKLCSFSKAAEVRHATPTAVCRRVKALEAWYGAPLVDRATYPITLTAAGISLLDVGERLLSDLYHFRREARASINETELSIKHQSSPFVRRTDGEPPGR